MLATAVLSSAEADSSVSHLTEGLMSSEGEPKVQRKRANRLTKAEKEKLALDKTVNKIMASGESYFELVYRLDKWLQQNCTRAMNLLTDFNPEGLTEVTYGQFKAAMHDLAIPCTAVELHLLCKLLDSEEKEVIDINQLQNGLSFVWRNEEENYRKEDVCPVLSLTNEKYAHCSKGGCTMAQWNGEPYKIAAPRYLLIHFRLLSFDHFSQHVGHFSDVIPGHTTIFHLTKVIGDRTSIIMPHAIIYTDKSRDPKSILAPDLTLEECGFEGGSSNTPKELLLYYDYAVELKECPLLLCDHYLAKKTKVSKHTENPERRISKNDQNFIRNH